MENIQEQFNNEKKEFSIKRNYKTIILEKGKNVLSINQGIDDDIWFSSSQDNISFDLNFASRNYKEWQTFIIFEYLMKCIIGRYMLSGDYLDEYSFFPKDFIDLDKKIILWHSDSGVDDILKLEYVDYKLIRISIIKDTNSKGNNGAVRIRTSGSDYGYYYQEFLEFFKQLLILEGRLNQVASVSPQIYNKKL